MVISYQPYKYLPTRLRSRSVGMGSLQPCASSGRQGGGYSQQPQEAHDPARSNRLERSLIPKWHVTIFGICQHMTIFLWLRCANTPLVRVGHASLAASGRGNRSSLPPSSSLHTLRRLRYPSGRLEYYDE